ncbi:hypothetical protein CHH80_12470 [Bacillus sp. 7504-2]|nr:hypothetical protein CHH80_12470 [Bacillus sp. 7504-2]
MLFSKFSGGRILKTGISVFLTALICLALEWPAIFAVITAIVTIEPTASDSIKKGIVRFPASVIGAAYSMFFTAWFGNSAITYSLSAMLTIFTCHKLKLDAGILVATLTAVNMIPFTDAQFFDSFLVRLGTTSIGLAISTVVNLLILPPHYGKIIVDSTAELLANSAILLKMVFIDVSKGKKKKGTLDLFHRVLKDLEKAEQFCHFQRQEWKYHKHSEREMQKVHYEHKKILVIRQILFHLGNIIHAPINNSNNNLKNGKEIIAVVNSLALMLADRGNDKSPDHDALIANLLQYFWDLKNEKIMSCHFTAETTVLYEVLVLNDLVEKLNEIELTKK